MKSFLFQQYYHCTISNATIISQNITGFVWLQTWKCGSFPHRWTVGCVEMTEFHHLVSLLFFVYISGVAKPLGSFYKQLCEQSQLLTREKLCFSPFLNFVNVWQNILTAAVAQCIPTKGYNELAGATELCNTSTRLHSYIQIMPKHTHFLQNTSFCVSFSQNMITDHPVYIHLDINTWLTQHKIYSIMSLICFLGTLMSPFLVQWIETHQFYIQVRYQVW